MHTPDHGGEIRLHAVERDANRLRVDGFDPDLIVLNNDLSGGRPTILQGLEQPIEPSLDQGWDQRSKTAYFAHYHDTVTEFAAAIDFGDPWLLNPLYYDCREIDFMKREGEECLGRRSEKLFAEVRGKYAEHGIKAEPYAVLKADNGTYGMGIMTIRDPAEAVALNRKQRTRMSTVKEGRKVTRVLVQEGIPTVESFGERPAEPVVYTISHNVVGGFYRTHGQRGSADNLNSPGMRFEPIAFADCCAPPDPYNPPGTHARRFYSYGVIGRLAILATAREASAAVTGQRGAPPPA